MSEGQSSSSCASSSNLPSTSTTNVETTSEPSASTSNDTPLASSSTDTPSPSTSSQIPSTSSSSQAPSNLTSDPLPSTSNPSTSESPEKKDKGIDPLKMKILCIHGYKQNGRRFKAKLNAFHKLVKKYAYLVYATAPHAVADPSDRGDEDHRSWWFNTEDNKYSGKCLGGPAFGFEESLKIISLTVEEHGPFDGLMGFSQGACLVGLLAAMQQKNLLPFKFKFAMIISGYLSESLVHRGFYEHNIITIPSIHVYGESDSSIPKEMSESLINKFREPVVVEHPGGHYVPTSEPVKSAYEEFLADMYQQRLIDKQEAERTAE